MPLCNNLVTKNMEHSVFCLANCTPGSKASTDNLTDIGIHKGVVKWKILKIVILEVTHSIICNSFARKYKERDSNCEKQEKKIKCSTLKNAFIREVCEIEPSTSTFIGP